MSNRGDHIFHDGEIQAQNSFSPEFLDYIRRISGMIENHVSKNLADFIESQPFFFLSTSHKSGSCDCSFRGRDFNISGEFYPLLKVINQKTIIFPDFSGNHLYQSLGNIISNPNAALLFVDFERRIRGSV